MRNHSNVRRLLLLLAAFACLGLGPCGPIPGGKLSGEQVDTPVHDWSFANDVGRCAVEVRSISPHSVTVNCMSWQSDLFVSCSDCSGKRWSSYVRESAEGRIKIGDAIYPVTLKRVEDPALLDAVWRARLAKLGEDETEPRHEGWWAFRLRSR